MTKKAVESFLTPYNPEVRKIALKARSLVLGIFPDAVEQIDLPSKLIGYGYDQTYKGLVCAIMPYTAHVNLIFSKGVKLSDPAHLLEGAGKSARHVKFKSVADVTKPGVQSLLKAALVLQPS